MIFKESVLKRICFIQLFFLSAFTITAGVTYAQQIPQNQVVQNRLSELLLDADSSVFTGFRSQNWLELERLNIIHKTELADSVFGLSNSLDRNIKNTNLIRAVGKNAVFTIDPYLDAGIGK